MSCLKNQIEELICEGYLRHYVKSLMQKDEPNIVFEMGETEYPDHNDALVVLVCIANAKVKRVMIDTRSSINVLYFDVFHKLGLTTIDLSPMSTTLIGFTGDFIAPLGMIILLVIIEQEPRSKTMMVTFMVVNF
ncbi:hypothetical protein BHM03_00014003 [Ensete ventricosum]|nr:hypothetical protein BHM03_00014003 [Ensete ventricosum]